MVQVRAVWVVTLVGMAFFSEVSSHAGEEELARYEHPQYGFAIERIPGWHFEERVAPAVVAIVRDEGGAIGARPTVTVAVQDLTESMAAWQYAQGGKEALERLYPGIQLLGEEPAELEGSQISGHVVVYQLRQGEVDLYMCQAIYVHAGRKMAYVVTWADTIDDYHSHEPELTQIVDTFTIAE